MNGAKMSNYRKFLHYILVQYSAFYVGRTIGIENFKTGFLG